MLKIKNKAFTLIELLVVIAVIGLLATIVAVSINSARAKARDTKRLSDLKQFQTALEMCYDKQNSYVISGETIITSPCYRESLGDGDFRNGWQARCSEFLQNLPTDPKGYHYTIHTTNNYQHYVLLARLETDTHAMIQSEVNNFVQSVGITNWTPCSYFNYVIGH